MLLFTQIVIRKCIRKTTAAINTDNWWTTLKAKQTNKQTKQMKGNETLRMTNIIQY